MKGGASLTALNSPGFLLRASMGLVPGVSVINKFGATPDVDTATDPQDVWDAAPQTFSEDAGVYTFSSTDDIDSISSSDAADSGVITVQGLDGNWDFHSQEVTLNGQTRVALSKALIRVFRAFNNSATATAGDIYVYVNGAITLGVPDTKADIRAKVLITSQQTEMALYSIPRNCTGFMMASYVGMSKSGVNNIATFTHSSRLFGGIFLVKGRELTSTNGTTMYPRNLPVPIKLEAKSDIKFTCVEVSANDTGAVAGFDIVLFENDLWGLT